MRKFFPTHFLTLCSCLALGSLSLATLSHAANTAPEITGVNSSDLAINDNSTGAFPFPAVILTDADSDALTSASITISPAAQGSLKTESYITVNGGGSYTLSASNTSQLQARLRTIEFIPVANLLTPVTQYNVTIGISVSDGSAADTASRTVAITSVNDAPTITPDGLQTIDDNQSGLAIFSNVNLADVDAGQSATVSVTFNSLKGTFANPSGSAFTLSGTDTAKVLTLPAQNFSAAQSALRALAYTPEANLIKAGLSETVSFVISASDGIATGNGTKDVRINSINDAPVIAPATARNFTISAGASATMFGDISVTDADLDTTEDPGSGLTGSSGSSGDSFTATIVLSPSPYGSFNDGLFAPVSGNPAAFSFTGNRLAVQNAIRGAQYVAPGTQATYTATLTVRDSNNVASGNVVATIVVQQPAPGMTGLQNGQTVADNSTINPFSTASFNNFGGGDRYVEVTMDVDLKGAFENLGGFTKVLIVGSSPARYSYRMIGNSTVATNAIRGLRFRPTANRISGVSEQVTFNIKVRNVPNPIDTVIDPNLSALSSDQIALTVQPINDAPTILGASEDLFINDNQTATPFSQISIADLDESGNQPVTVNITLRGEDPVTKVPRDGGGVLTVSTGGGFTLQQIGSAPNITYRLTGTPSVVTTRLRALTFIPDEFRNAIGQRETIRFSIGADDSKGGSAQYTQARVTVTTISGAPKIIGIPELAQQPFAVPTTNANQVMPFQGLTSLLVEDNNPTITLTVSVDNASKGTFPTDVFTLSSSGNYIFQGTPAAITTALKNLVYTINPVFSFPSALPGLTTFTLTATDGTNITSTVFTIFTRDRNVAHIVNSVNNDGPGTLRQAVGLASEGDSIVFDFPDANFPVVITLENPIEITKSIQIIGSGVKNLSISGGGETGLFSVIDGATLTLEQLTLRDGAAPSYGGAVAVDIASRLVARYCEFNGNSAGQYGGAIDVFEGDIMVENCLFVDNFVEGSTADAGGAISVYSEISSSIVNTTFVNNRQMNPSGLGGGAIYAQNSNVSVFFPFHIRHCTFKDNTDSSGNAHAVLSSASGTRIHLVNNILVTTTGRVINVVGGGRFVSAGGNIATDSTVTTYQQGGTNVTLLDHATDRRSTNPLLSPLAFNYGATRTCKPESGSPAINNAVSMAADITPGTDQRGFWRPTGTGTLRDIGAHEVETFRRVNINEIYVSEDAGADFIEFYNPRDSENLDMANLRLWIDNELVHTFGSQVLVPGSGFVWMSTKNLNPEKGRIELRNSLGQLIHLVNYSATFSANDEILDTSMQSINRYPRYDGGFLPHGRVVEQVTGIVPGFPETSPGDDVDGSPLGGGNAPPLAFASPENLPSYTVYANELLAPDVLSNDIDFDRADTLKITEIMTVPTSGVVVNNELQSINGNGQITLQDLPPGLKTITTNGATVTVNPDGRGITYDPRTSATMIGLAKNQTITDVWAYTILDYDANGTPQSRGIDNSKKTTNIQKATAWFAVTVVGVNETPTPAADVAATSENHALRLLGNAPLLTNPGYNFGDLAVNFQEFDSAGNPVTLLPLHPTLALLENDTDVDSDDDKDTLILSAVHTTATPENLLVTTSALGARVVLDIRTNRHETNIFYDPRTSAYLNSLRDGEIATDSFHYSVLDRYGVRGVAKVTITVTGVNDVPRAQDDTNFSVYQNATLTIPHQDLLANDTDIDTKEVGDSDTIIIDSVVSTSQLGAQVSLSGGNIVYDPRNVEAFIRLSRNQTLTDTFAYTIDDGKGGSGTATVTVVVEGVNQAPVASNDLFAIFENQVGTRNLSSGLLSNDGDIDIDGTVPDDSPWVIAQRNVRTPLEALLHINPDGSFSYDANSAAIDSLKAGQVVTEVFPYTVIDNFRTTASDDHYKIFSNSSDVNLAVLLNDTVVGTSPTAIAGYSAGEGNKLVIQSANHSMRDGMRIRLQEYSGAGNYNGVHAITVVDRNSFSIDVPFVDDPASARGNWAPWFRITNVTAPDQGGTVTIADGQSLRYTPTISFFGHETFHYTIEDGIGGQDVGTVSVNVITAGFNGFVTASDDRYMIGSDTGSVSVAVLANDGILPSGSADLSVIEISPLNGATGLVEIINGGAALSYSPAPGFAGTESFSYKVTGGGSLTATAVVSFDVVTRLNALDAQPDHFTVVTNSANNLFPVLENDKVLPEYAVLPAIIAVNGSDQPVTSAAGGTVTVTGNQISYSAPATATTDSFTYTIRDASGATTTRNVNVNIVATSEDFYAVDNHYLVAAGAGAVTLPVLSNDVIVGAPGLNPTITALGIGPNAPPVPQRVTIVNGQSLQYTPPNTAATESFTYEIGVGTTERRSARITITTVGAFATMPSAKADDFKVAKNSGSHSLNVLANDIPYPDAGWRWTISALGNASHGGTVAIINNGNALSYAPAEGFVGVETFTYTIRDSIGNTSPASVTIRVGDLFTSPDHFAVLENSSPVLMQVLANDNLLSIGSADYSISSVSTTSAMGGTVSIQGTGPANNVLYQPAASFSGIDTFSYTVIDSSGGTYEEQVMIDVIKSTSDRATASLTVQITGVNDLPVITGLANAAINDKQTVNPFANISISDIDEGGNQAQTAQFQFDISLGTISAPGITLVSPGVYSISGTPAEITDALRAVVFTPFENLALYIDPGQSSAVFTLSLDDGYVDTILTETVTITVSGINDAPAPLNDVAATFENQAIRLMADATLLSSPGFNFGDRASDFRDFNGGTEQVVLLPPHPTKSLLANDNDVDADDDNTTILIGAIHTTAVPTDLLITTSQLGARVALDIRADRKETNILYDPRASSVLNALPMGVTVEDSFYYSVFDRHGARGIAKVTITVTGVNDLPRATDDDGFTVTEDLKLNLNASSLTRNDSDPDTGEGGGPGESLTITSISSISQLGAVLTLNVAQQTIRYDPTTIPVFQSLARNESVEDFFTYTTTDASGGTSAATARLTVFGVNDAPVSTDDLHSIVENATSNVSTALGLMANDGDVDINGTVPDDSPWIIPQREVITPLGASLEIRSDGSYRYDANSRAIDSLIQGEIAHETFPYTIVDNFRTQAADDEFKVFASSSNVALPVLANDVVIGTSPTSVAGYSAGTGGKLLIQSPNHSLRDGLLVRISGYSGSGNYNGVHAITSVGRNSFTVDVPFVDDPVGARGTWIPWLEISSVSAGNKGGGISVVDGQGLTYTPTPGFYGTETFTYAIHDGVGGQDVAHVDITVIRPEYNGRISASNDYYSIGMGSPTEIVNVLSNDGIAPANGNYLTISAVTPVAGASGVVNIVNDGKNLSYTPSSNSYLGTESFVYTVIGRDADTTTATVTFEVVDRTGKLDGSHDDFFVVLGSANNPLDVLANDPVMPSYPVSSRIVSIGGTPQGTAVIAANKILYTPGAAVGIDTFTYSARDASGANMTRNVRVHVVADAPDFVAVNDHYTVLAGSGPLTLPLLVNDGTVSEQDSTIRIVNLGLDTNAPPDPDRTAIFGNGIGVLYTPPVTARTETFTYETSIGKELDLRRRVATVTITVVESFATVPIAYPDAFHVAKNSGPQTFDVLANDIPLPDAGWRWVISDVTETAHGGQVQIQSGATVSYLPASGFFGIDTFGYTIADEFGNNHTATVTVRVGGMDTATDHFTVLQNSTAQVMPVLLNDDLLESEAATYQISAVSSPSAQGGQISIIGSGPNNAVSYTPASNFTGQDTFSYTVTDKTGGLKVETVDVLVIPSTADRDASVLTVRVTGVNDVPVIAGLANRSITDKQTVKPFETIDIRDLDQSGNQNQRVTVSFNPTKGSMSAPGMTLLSPGTYRKDGTPAEVSAALRAMVFTPLENIIDYINPGNEDVPFALTVTDFWVPTPLQVTTIVKVTPVNDAPTIITPIPDQVVHVNAMPSVINLLFHFTDVDDSVSSGQLVWTITQNTNPALFSSSVINHATKQLTFSYAANQVGLSDITLRGTDRGGLFVERSFRIIVEGPPVIVLPSGETSPPAAALISTNGSVRTYRQSFRIQNTGTLPVLSFIVHITGLNQPVSGISLMNGEFSTNENSTTTNFADDTRSSANVTRLTLSTAASDVKYNLGIAPNSSTVVHLTYQVSSINPIVIRPTYRVSLTTANPAGVLGATKLTRTPSGSMQITANLAANKVYQFQYSSDLASWTNWTTPMAASAFPRQVQFIDDGSVTMVRPSSSPKRFYRFVEVITP